MKTNLNKKSGFTLVELVVVMIILGILAGTAISKLGGSDKGAYIASMKADARQAIAAANNVYVSESEYPANTTSVASTTKTGGTPTKIVTAGGTTTTVVLSSSPFNTVTIKDSANASGNCSAITDGYLVTVTNTKLSEKITFDSCDDAGIVLN